jgi:predicted transcriptional regulator
MNRKTRISTSHKVIAPLPDGSTFGNERNLKAIPFKGNIKFLTTCSILFILIFSALAAVSEGASESRADPPGDLENIDISVMDLQENPYKHVYPGSSPFLLRVTVKMNAPLNSISTVSLIIDPNGLDITMSWDIVTGEITKSNDENNYVTLVTGESGASNDGINTWYIDHALKFSWDYPDDREMNCFVVSEASTDYKDSDLYQNVFIYENDLMFTGALSVQDLNNEVIDEITWVPGSSILKWSGPSVIFKNSSDYGEPIYPELSGMFFKLEEEQSGNFWEVPIERGAPLDIQTFSGTESIPNAVFTLSLRGMPANVKLNNQLSYGLLIDAEPLVFYDYNPLELDKIFSDTIVKCRISIKDLGGSGVDFESIEYATSIHGPDNYGPWLKVADDDKKRSITGTIIDIVQDITFTNGTDNYIKWRAVDIAGNSDTEGFYESEDLHIRIDVNYVVNYPPTVRLDHPRPSTVYYTNEQITFSGMDSYDSDWDPLTYSWSSNISGFLSTEPWFQAELEPGHHLITLQIADGMGHSATETVEITIQAMEREIVESGEENAGLVLGPSRATSATALSLLIATLYFFVGTEVGKYKFLGFAIPLYSKLTKQMVLDHETRGLIRGYIIANPGDHFTSIKKHIGLKNGTLAYHLKILERENIIKSHRDGIFKRFYPMNTKITRDMVHMSKQEIILNKIIEQPGISRKELALQVGLSRQVINYHSKGLIQAGLVRSEKYGKRIQYYANEPLTTDMLA